MDATPQKKNWPSGRDMAIYYEVRILHRTQEEVAKQFDLSQARVSQITREMATWRGHQEYCGGDHDERLSFLECRDRTETMLGWTMADYLQSRQNLTITKKGRRGDAEYEETVVREQRANSSLMRSMIALNTQLLELGRCKPPPVSRSFEIDFRAPYDVLLSVRWLTQVRDGYRTVDQVDWEAAHLRSDTGQSYARMWKRFEGAVPAEPSEDVAASPQMEPPTGYVARYGRHYVMPDGTVVIAGPIPSTDLQAANEVLVDDPRKVRATDNSYKSPPRPQPVRSEPAAREVAVSPVQATACDEGREPAYVAPPESPAEKSPLIINSDPPGATGILPVPKQPVGEVSASDERTASSGFGTNDEPSLPASPPCSKKPLGNGSAEHQLTMKNQHGQDARGTPQPDVKPVAEPIADDPKFAAALARYEKLFYPGRKITAWERERLRPIVAARLAKDEKSRQQMAERKPGARIAPPSQGTARAPTFGAQPVGCTSP